MFEINFFFYYLEIFVFKKLQENKYLYEDLVLT